MPIRYHFIRELRYQEIRTSNYEARRGGLRFLTELSRTSLIEFLPVSSLEAESRSSLASARLLAAAFADAEADKL